MLWGEKRNICYPWSITLTTQADTIIVLFHKLQTCHLPNVNFVGKSPLTLFLYRDTPYPTELYNLNIWSRFEENPFPKFYSLCRFHNRCLVHTKQMAFKTQSFNLAGRIQIAWCNHSYVPCFYNPNPHGPVFLIICDGLHSTNQDDYKDLHTYVSESYLPA